MILQETMTKKVEEAEQENELRMKLEQFRLACDKERHAMRMKEIEFLRESDKQHHERELERGRIRSAEIRKDFERRNRERLARTYR